MSDMFEYLEAQAVEENLPFRNAAVVAIDRAERRFASFVEGAQGEKEFKARVELIRGEIEKIAVAVCEEFGYEDPAHIAKLAVGQIELLAATPEPAGKADQTQKLVSQKPDGYYTEPSPKLNPGSAGDHMKNTNPAIPELTPDDKQNAIDKEWPWDGALPAENRVDITKQGPEQVGPNTQTFPNKGQADPVTSKTAAEPNWNNSDMDENAAWDDSDEYEDVPLVNYNYEDDLEDPELYALQEEMDAPYSDMSPMYQSERLKKWEGPVDNDKSGLHGENGGEGSGWSDRKNWKNYRDQQYKPTMARSAAERMDFSALSELMTPSDAVGHLVESGMPQHEAKDRIDFYVNHVDPGWAHKSWTSSEQKESMWDQSNPELMEMSYDVDSPTVESIRQVYEQRKNAESFESPRQAVDTLFMMYAENARTPEQVDTIANMFEEAIGMTPSNVEEVKQYAMRFASVKHADHPGVMQDIISMMEERLQNGVDFKGRRLNRSEMQQMRREIDRMKSMQAEAEGDYFTPGMNIDINEEMKTKREMPDKIVNEMQDITNPIVPSNSQTVKNPVKYQFNASSIYSKFLKKQAEQ